MYKFKVSIIICFFNSENTLESMIKDAINQTLKNKEIILVNDGSYDRSLEIAEKYAKQYDFIKIVNQKNSGLSISRNSGVQTAEGEYIIYWDSDDSVESTALEILYNRAKAEKADVVCSQVYIYFHSRDIKRKSKTPFPKYSITGREALENLFRTTYQSFGKGNFVTGTIWDKMIRRDLILKNNIEYKNVLFEDIVFITNTLMKAEKVSFVNNYFYTNYQWPRSMSATISVINKSLKALNDIKLLLEKENLYEKYEELYEIFYLQFLFFISFKQVYTITTNSTDKVVYKAYKKKLISVLDEIKNSEDFKIYYQKLKKRRFNKVQTFIKIFLMIWNFRSKLYVYSSIFVYKYFLKNQ